MKITGCRSIIDELIVIWFQNVEKLDRSSSKGKDENHWMQIHHRIFEQGTSEMIKVTGFKTIIDVGKMLKGRQIFKQGKDENRWMQSRESG
ncbi:hypothetical protein CEXT_811561 [Caerostris extrusa]|uniref:Uncharacterized protein n=1 Tax=Caerostris extrusa TaxID=172846 RepID=A0AAV4WVT2_CAEEX|nr:hypothetical protein CEXT_811561 [Caerostris extrusa]